MNEVGHPARAVADLSAEMGEAARALLAALLLTCLLVTFQPFQTTFAGAVNSGNAVNQIGYGLLGVGAIAAMLTVTPRPALRALLRPTWILMGVVLLQSALHSPWPDASLRAVLFALAAMMATAAVLCLPANLRGFRFALAFAALTVLALCYVGVAVLPAAIHDGSGPEPQHAGLWRGLYPHKNMAGPVMAVLFFAGLYLWRCRWRFVGLSIALPAAIFVVHTGSKTSGALLPLVALLVAMGRRIGGRRLPVIVLSVTLVCLAALTLGAALSPSLYALLQWILPGTTFTGRLDLWRFALDTSADHRWTGLGFESFWTTPVVMSAELPIELTWDPRGIVNAHNGYLDLAIALGWPGLAVAVAMIVILPFADFLRIGQGGEDVRLADFFLMVLAFALLNAMLESFLFARGNPVWITAWMAIVGLRLLAVRSRDLNRL
ncbi:O-antigen ligase [Aureimonas sp. AU12]|uniref:O-antigen ligase family protein n=1 Tax=Aureimonas sp. AU12 TaxID=1638161 RepID=UPI000AAC1C57|nr:O-antigen ligase [Aureimonas sp. AU12]